MSFVGWTCVSCGGLKNLFCVCGVASAWRFPTCSTDVPDPGWWVNSSKMMVTVSTTNVHEEPLIHITIAISNHYQYYHHCVYAYSLWLSCFKTIRYSHHSHQLRMWWATSSSRAPAMRSAKGGRGEDRTAQCRKSLAELMVTAELNIVKWSAVKNG